MNGSVNHYRDGYLVTRVLDEFPDGRRAIVLSHPELPGCTAYGDTDAEALDRLDGARRAYIAVSERRGEIVPRPAFMHLATIVTFTPGIETANPYIVSVTS